MDPEGKRGREGSDKRLKWRLSDKNWGSVMGSGERSRSGSTTYSYGLAFVWCRCGGVVIMENEIGGLGGRSNVKKSMNDRGEAKRVDVGSQ